MQHLLRPEQRTCMPDGDPVSAPAIPARCRPPCLPFTCSIKTTKGVQQHSLSLLLTTCKGKSSYKSRNASGLTRGWEFTSGLAPATSSL